MLLQHDSQEFLAMVLDSLHEDLNYASSKSVLSGSESNGSDMAVDEKTEEDKVESVKRNCSREEDLYNNSSVQHLRSVCSQPQHVEEDSNQSSASLQSSDAQLSLGVTKIDIKSSPHSEICTPDTNICTALKDADLETEKAKLSINISNIAKQNTTELDTPGRVSNRNDVPEAEMLKVTEKFLCITPRSPEKNELLNRRNTESILPAGIEEFYLKDVKVSNTNVLVCDEENEVTHSGKFLKSSNHPLPTPLTYDNLHGNFPCGICKTIPCTKVKDTNLQMVGQSSSLIQPVKETKLSTNLESLNESFTANNFKRNQSFDDEEKPRVLQKRFKNEMSDSLSSTVGEDAQNQAKQEGCCKNAENESDVGCSSHRSADVVGPTRLDPDDEEADMAWWKHHSKHKSIIVDTFQGQFKSMV